MKKTKRLFAVILVVAALCSVMSIGASAASTSTYLSFTGASGIYYYISYSGTSYEVGFNKTNNEKPVKVVQAVCYERYTFPTHSTSYIDGLFGVTTYGAVCGYQGKYGLTVDGTVGSITWKDMGYTHYTSAIINDL